MGQANMWVESLWLTHRESVTIEDPVTKNMVTRDVSVGMTIKSDKSAKSTDMYEAVRSALNRIVEEEKERWLDSHLMAQEASSLKRNLEEVDHGSGNEGQEGTVQTDDGGTTGTAQ